MRNGLGTRSFKDHCNKQNYNSYNLQQRQEQCVFLKDLYGLNLKIVVGFFFFTLKGHILVLIKIGLNINELHFFH